jgi:hypothetical protein
MNNRSHGSCSGQPSPHHSRIVLAVAMVLVIAASCSASPRDEYTEELVSGIRKIYSALEDYRTNPSGVGKSEGPVQMEVNGKKVTATGNDALLVSQSYAEVVGGRTKSFWDQLQTLKFPMFMDVQSDKGYEKWVVAAAKRLRAEADKCLTMVDQIKSEYKANPESSVYQSSFIGRPYRTVRLTPQDELIFALNMQKGIIVERILKTDFRRVLDGIHNQGKSAEKAEDKDVGPETE